MHDFNLDCTQSHWMEEEQIEINVKNNGMIFIYNCDPEQYIITDFCLDSRYESASGLTLDAVQFCFPSPTPTLMLIVLRTAMILSSICLIYVIEIYVFVHKLKNVVQKLTVCYCFVDLISYVVKTHTYFPVEYGSFCIYNGYIYVFLMISRLSWRNALSFEIYRTIG